MFRNGRAEAEENIRRLEMLVEELQGVSVVPPEGPDDTLRLLEAAMTRHLGCNTWIAKVERLAWHISAPLWDFQVRRQIRLVWETVNLVGANSIAASDLIGRLDDLIFARTYGRIVAAPIKRMVRQIAAGGELSIHELRNLVINRCFRLGPDGRVEVPSEPWLLSLGILQLILATAVLAPYMLLILFSQLDFGRQLFALAIVVAPYWLACWHVRRHFIGPYRLIPKAQELLPKVQPVCI